MNNTRDISSHACAIHMHADVNEVDKLTEKLQGVGIASASADGAVLTTSKGTPSFRGQGRCNGERRRKSVRGCIVSQEMSVLNLVFLKKGKNDPPGLTDMEHGCRDRLIPIKDIENRFFRASECGKEVSRMLETNKVVSKFSDGKEPPKQVTKAITWYRSPSSQSSSLRNRLTSASRDDDYESERDFNGVLNDHRKLLVHLGQTGKPLKVLLRIQETLYRLCRLVMERHTLPVISDDGGCLPYRRKILQRNFFKKPQQQHQINSGEIAEQGATAATSNFCNAATTSYSNTTTTSFPVAIATSTISTTDTFMKPN
ncbi:hypothetical protein C5167_049104 [Papaver somniferum]|uniref:DUF632 domain-containing protein n=1 Tax=Papaver somniferum TaxID=3469 RepID=A0A4Y7KJV4_PAPSO|nr:hypothetical protein C5167_049104 [Papaver somniferum]